MTQSGEIFPAAQRFEKLYRGDPSLDGGPKPIGIPWDIHQPQPQLMELEALGGIADATNLTGCDERFDTVIDSALYQCLDEDGRQAYAAGLYRATR